MKRDKWFLNSPSKWNIFKGLKNIYDWYLILTFPTTIFLKVHAHYRHELVFFWRFSRPRGGATVSRQTRSVQKRYPQYGIHIWRWWPNIRFLPSTVTEKNAMNNILDGRTEVKQYIPPPPSGSAGIIKWKYLSQKFHDICLSYYFNTN